MVKLFCAIVGQAGSAFPVDIDESLTVGDLKEEIKEKKKTTITCDANELQLFLAKKKTKESKGKGPWLVSNEVESGWNETSDQKLLNAGATLHMYGLSETVVKSEVPFTEEDADAGRMPVHVLVVVPTQVKTSNEMARATMPLTVEQMEMTMKRVLRERDEKVSEFSFSELNAAMEERILKKMRLTEHFPDIKEPVDKSIEGYQWIPNLSESAKSQRAG